MSDTKHYYKTMVKRDNIEAEYSSEDDQITLTLHRKTVGGDYLGTEFWHINPAEIEPLYSLLKEIVARPNPTEETKS